MIEVIFRSWKVNSVVCQHQVLKQHGHNFGFHYTLPNIGCTNYLCIHAFKFFANEGIIRVSIIQCRFCQTCFLKSIFCIKSL